MDGSRVASGARTQIWERMRDLHPLEGAAVLLTIGFRIPPQTVARALAIPQGHVGRLCVQGLRTLRAAHAGAGHGSQRRVRSAANPAHP